MLNFGITIDGVQEFSRAFNRIEQQLDDLRFVWPAVSQEIYKIEGEQFASEGAKGASGKWAALSKAYAKFKAVKFPGKTKLQATGSLFDSLTDPDALDAVFQPEEKLLTIGTKVPYAIYHQRGAEQVIKKGLRSGSFFTLPKRPIFSFKESQKRRIQKAIQVGLVQFIRRQGFNVQGTTHDLAA